MLLVWTLVVWLWSVDPSYAQNSVASAVPDEWPPGTTSITDLLNANYTNLHACQQSCFQNNLYNIFDAAKSRCQDLDSSLVILYECINAPSQSSDCKNNSLSVQAAQLALVNYCVQLEEHALSDREAFTIPATPLSYPVTDLSTIGVSSLTKVPASSTATTTATSAITPGSSTSPVATGVQASADPAVTTTDSNKGLSQKEQIGIGVGVGVGVPVIIGVLAALFFLARRRKHKATDGANPYGAVYADDKAAMADGSGHAGPKETHPMNSSATPFLPVPVVGDSPHHHEDEHETEHEHEQAPIMENDRSFPAAFQDEPQALQHQPRSLSTIPPARPQTHTVVPLQVRHSYRTSTPIDDEPPSPVSPVSPVSEMGSRPASLISGNHRHDL